MAPLLRFPKNPRRVTALAAVVGLATIVAPAVMAAPASAGKSTSNCAPPSSIVTSYPTPAPAYSVTARNYGIEKGKAKIFWKVPNTDWPSGYQLWMVILGSEGRCSKAAVNKPGNGCVKTAGKKGYSCILTRLPSGDTEFTVALWYQQKNSSASGPIAYSPPSNTVDVS